MSTAAVREFLSKVAEDESLQGELAQALEAENDRQAVTELANSKGYEFTPEELWSEIQRRQTEFEKIKRASELSDEDLKEIVAGTIPAAIVQVAL